MGSGADPIEDQIQQVGQKLLAGVQGEIPKVRRAHRWESQVLTWCFRDETLRTQILRFIDCLPALHHPHQIVRHLQEYFPEPNRGLPLPLRLGLSATRPGLLSAQAVAASTRFLVSSMARFFIAGGTVEEALAVLEPLEKQGFRLTVDLLGEATLSEAEADRYTEQYLQLIQKWNEVLSTPVHVSLKLSALAFPFDPADPEGTWRRIRPRMERILRAAFAAGGFVNVDMEQYVLRDLTLTLTQRMLEETFPKEQNVGVVIQAYLKDSVEITERLLKWVRARGTPLIVRLVRGAYWDSEVIRSQQLGWPCPVYTRKAETDASFERLTDLLLEHHELIRLGLATHNLRSVARAIVKARQLNVPQDHWECQVLYGMGQAVQRVVADLGLPVRIYAPVGHLIPGMAYLVRRILENTSHTSFLAMNLLEESV